MQVPWTKLLGGVRGILLRKKNWHLRSSNYWKYIELVNPTITSSFCIIISTFYGRVSSGRPFGSKEGMRSPLSTSQTPQNPAVQSRRRDEQFQANEFWTESQDLWVISQSGFYKLLTPLQPQTVTWLESKNLSWKNVSLVLLLVLWSLR